MKRNLLGAVTSLLAALGGCAPAQPPAVPKELDPSCARGIAQRSTALLELKEPRDAIESGGVLLLRDAWVLAGIQTDQPPPRYSDETRRIVPRFVHSGSGELVPAPDDAVGVPMDIPIPVLLADGRWGALWAKATPPRWREGAWPADRYTEIWFSGRTVGGWQPARVVLRANMGIDWRYGRTLQYARSGTLMMVVQEEQIMDRRVMFGSPEHGLRRIAVDSTLSPYAATFLVLPDGTITAVVQTGPASGDPGIPATFALIHSANGGNTWSRPEPIGFPSGAAQHLQLHVDRAGGLHLVWLDNGRLRHGMLTKPAAGWVEMPVPNQLIGARLVGVASGITRAGELAIVRETASETTDAQIVIACFRNGSWAAYEPIALSAYYLLSGTAYDDRWVIGWSAARDGSSGVGMTVWAVMP